MQAGGVSRSGRLAVAGGLTSRGERHSVLIPPVASGVRRMTKGEYNVSRFTGKLLVGVLVVAATAIGSSPASAKQEVERPFKATGIGTIEIEVFDDCEFGDFPDVVCDQVIETVVKATHLGKSANTSVGEATIHVFTQCTTPDGNPDGVLFDVTSTAVIVAANGDELYVNQNVSGCGDGIGLSEPTGTYTITGGTGRFEGATGNGELSAATFDGAFSNTYAGTITY
jgi:hypothetical protein